MGIRNYIARAVLGSEMERRSSVAVLDPSTLTVNLPATVPNRLVTFPEAGLASATVFRAVSMIADSVAAMPWATWYPDTNTVVPDQPAILRRPDPFHQLPDTFRQLVTSLLLNGEAFMFLTAPDRTGRPTVAIPIDSHEVTVSWDESRIRPVYRWRGELVTINRDLLHVKYIDDVRTLRGIGPIQAARWSVAGAVEAERFAVEWFTEGAVPDAVLETNQILTDTQAERLRAQWSGANGGRRGTAVLEGGLEYKPITMSNADSQFIESRQFSAADLARLFGIPAPLLNASSAGSSTLQYRNQEGLMTEYATFAIQPIAERIESAFTPLVPSTQEIRFDYTQLVRADLKSRYDVYAIARDHDILTVNEIRRAEGLPPLAGGGDVPATADIDEGATT